MFVELARWFRNQQRRDKNFAVRNLPAEALDAKPHTQLLLIARSAAGRSFLAEKESELKEEFRSHSNSGQGADIAAQIGSVLHLQGKLDQALCYFQKAIILDSQMVQCKGESRFMCKLTRVQRQIASDSLHRGWVDGSLLKPAADIVPVPVRAACDLSVEDFLQNFAVPGVPVVLRGLIDGGMFRDGPWEINALRDRLGDRTFVPRRRCALSPDWANLEDCPATGIRAFIQQLQDQEHAGDTDAAGAGVPRAAGYLFDWNLPKSEPQLCDELRIPAYFATDWLQARTPRMHAPQAAHPQDLQPHPHPHPHPHHICFPPPPLRAPIGQVAWGFRSGCQRARCTGRAGRRSSSGPAAAAGARRCLRWRGRGPRGAARAPSREPDRA